jgi:hypothetical protein
MAAQSNEEIFQKIERFRRGVRELNECWENRFVPERENLVESYLKGRFESHSTVGLPGPR